MYEKFFNLKTKPFELVPNPDFLFMSRSHKRALIYTEYGLSEKIGFILITGEVGTGKTTLIRNVIKRLNGKVTLSKVFNTRVTSEQLLAMINDDFGLDVTGKDKITMLRELNDFLIEEYANNRQSILIIDEAQNLTPDLLEEVRLLSNLETDGSKLLQIILVGQPELRRTLARPELRQLRQRISISCQLKPLTRQEVEDYIYHRFKVAGNADAVKFEEKSFDYIYSYSRGIPRLINIICDFLLLSAYVEEQREIKVELVKDIIGELEMENRFWQDESIDETPSGSKSLVRDFQDLETRLKQVEDTVLKTGLTPDDKVEIYEKIKSSEKMLHSFLEETRASISNMKEKIERITDEIETIKKTVADLTNRLNKQKENRKGFLNRII